MSEKNWTFGWYFHWRDRRNVLVGLVTGTFIEFLTIRHDRPDQKMRPEVLDLTQAQRRRTLFKLVEKPDHQSETQLLEVAVWRQAEKTR